MSSLIVIRITPQKPVDAQTFESALAGLSIALSSLDFTSVDNQPPGSGPVTAQYVDITPSGGWAVAGSGGPYTPGAVLAINPPQYPSGMTSGIVQQVDYLPFSPPFDSVYMLTSVATAVVSVPWTAPQLENISVTATRGGATIALNTDYYVLPPNTAALPDLTSWSPSGEESDPWSQLTADLYLSLPPAPSSSPAAAFQMPTDGSAPNFDALLSAVQAVLQLDPGAMAAINVVAPGAAAGVASLPFAAAALTNVTPGMSVSGAGVPAGAVVTAVSGSSVTLNVQVEAAGVPAGTPITFAPSLAGLSVNQCANIAYELLWCQQPPLPGPPNGDAIETLYTNPPNDGTLLSGGSTPNQAEGDREQFEAQLKAYYATPNANAERLTSYVYALSAAVACEQMSLAAAQALITFPAQPGLGAPSASSNLAVILTGLGLAAGPANFGVPAAYFYALASANPTSQNALARYGQACGDTLAQLLSQLTAAIDSANVSDGEAFVTASAGGKINAAQAARRICALGVPKSSSSALAPLGAQALSTSQATASGDSLTFASVAGIKAGMQANGQGLPPGGEVSSVTMATGGVTLSAPVLAAAPVGTVVTFTPAYAADLKSLVEAWLAFPPTPQGSVSSQDYQPGDDDTLFWPQASATQPTAFLELVLSAVTGGYIIPPPFETALGDKILDYLQTLSASPTVATLAGVTKAQWAALFTPNPLWLPPQPGGVGAQIGAFVETLTAAMPVASGGPHSAVNLATSTATASGAVLTFISTNGVQPGWSASSLATTASNQPLIPNGALVVSPGGVTPTTIALTVAVAGPVPSGTNITFRPVVAAASAGTLPVLPSPPAWIGNCLTIYDPSYMFGQGISNPAHLAAAANDVLPGDAAAQAWLVAAITNIDALCALVIAAGQTIASTAGPAPLAGALGFSMVEALYACGFRSAADIAALSEAEFEQALLGSVAFASADAIWTAATKASPQPTPAPSGQPGFHPVNPDGSLTNCIPPLNLSPLGPVAYLSELLNLSQNASLADLQPASPGQTLGQAVSARRGPLGDLSASAANLETPIPLIDLVNECLEAMVAATTPAGGVIYDTAGDALAGLSLCDLDACASETVEDEPGHDPMRLFGALPQHSTPANPTAANAAVEPSAYEALATDFSTPLLPYSQPLDVNRTYLKALGGCRFETMRTFRRCITEFVLAPDADPQQFDDQVWRYPVRLDIAIEYLGLSQAEYAELFDGARLPRCFGEGSRDNDPALGDVQDAGASDAAQVRAQADASGDQDDALGTPLPTFLAQTGLSYCEFIELWKSGFAALRAGVRGQADADEDRTQAEFPECEPCCLDQFTLGVSLDVDKDRAVGLGVVSVFVRLWRKLREHSCCGYSFAVLADICQVLKLSLGGGLNRQFIRQLAAFQMLRDDFRLPIAEPWIAAGATGVARTALLALWVTPPAPQLPWAIHELIEGVARYAQRRFGCRPRGEDFTGALASNLDSLSRLAGFDPASATDNWRASPTHTLRFAEILAKIYASPFHLSDLTYLFTVDPLPDSHSPFPAQEAHEALAEPLGLPEGRHDHQLLRLRRRLLETAFDETECDHWDWRRIAADLRTAFGFAEADILAFGQHFFPRALEHARYNPPAQTTRFTSALDPSATTPALWNIPPNGPFQYDPGGKALWTALPLRDEAVFAKLEGGHDFSTAEQAAIQDLYFQPRALLAQFAQLFPNFAEAVGALVEGHEEERWRYFKRCFALAAARRQIIARHLAHHVAEVTGRHDPRGEETALLVLSGLLADENSAAAGASWENQDGSAPATTWTAPNGSALAALLALGGVGLPAEYAVEGGGVVWRDLSSALHGFGDQRDRRNCPVPTVLPALDAVPPAGQSTYVAVHNGLMQANLGGDWLGGAQGFTVTWSGALLVEHEGHYEFWAGAPRPAEDRPDFDAESGASWLITLSRGARSWVVSSRDWSGQADRRFAAIPLRPGAYDLNIQLTQPGPDFTPASGVAPRRTGLELKYAGADTEGRCQAVPHHRLAPTAKKGPLGMGLTGLAGGAADYLNNLYFSSLRDMRRTYQRAFKALMFCDRFALKAAERLSEPSELSYMLSHSTQFAGTGFFNSGAMFDYQRADFNFNLLPIADDYDPPAADQRAAPTPQRIWALFDIWERVFDYTVLRGAAGRNHGHPWRLFEEAADKQPAQPQYLLREIGAPPEQRTLDLTYFQGQGQAPYVISATDLEDERWTIRAWRADRWLNQMRRFFTATDLADARPDLWAADNPAAVAGELSGNGNLLDFLLAGALDNGRPRRYDLVRQLNDDLRRRARDALAAYLCADNRTVLPWDTSQFATAPIDLSAILLLDVSAGVDERASRIQEAISAVQTYVRRARLGLESGWTVSPGFARLWDKRFASFDIWRACKARSLYKEDWLEWVDLEKSRKVEAFRFLEQELSQRALSVAEPGGGDWWPHTPAPDHAGLPLVQQTQPARIAQLTSPREGLGLLGSPERQGRPAWLAALPPKPGAAQNPSGSSAPPVAADTPFWLKAAVGLGVTFVRLHAAGAPPAARFGAWLGEASDCVSCCDLCGETHEPGVDEYYFWLVAGRYFDNAPAPSGVAPSETNDGYQYGFQDDYYDPDQQQSTYWQDLTQLPQLLAWSSQPMVRLAWCRVHEGQFLQPQRSTFGVMVQPGATVDLSFDGRSADSLFFSVTNAVAPQGYGDSTPPGFRYDLACDEVHTLPLVSTTATAGLSAGGLPAYPWFVFAQPGEPPFPLTPFNPAVAVARWLRAHCRFEAALNWYRWAFDPLQSDCAWMRCDKQTPGQNPTPTARQTPSADAQDEVLAPAPDPQSACCDSADVDCDLARQRALLLLYLETLAEWGHALMRRRRSPEAFQQGRVIFDAARKVLGPRPISVRMPQPANPPKVSAFKPESAPLNPRLLELYGRVEDQLALIHDCVDARRFPDAAAQGHGPYFGESPLREGWRTETDPCGDEAIWCHPHSPYRFNFLIQKALDYAAKAQELGAGLLAAFEKGDAEYLGTLRADHELALLKLGLDSKKDQWREADWQVESLQKTKAVNQNNLTYYNNLITVNLINGEIQYENYVNTALGVRSAANAVEAIGEGLRLIPDFVVGAAGFGGSPVAISWLPLGTKLGDMFAAVARIMNNCAQIDSETASLDLTEAGWSRRYVDWVHQTQVLAIEIQQVERQILGAQRRRDQMLRDLNTHQRQIEQSAEVDRFLREKFTNHDLYLYLQRETASLYYRTFELALDAARQAERAFNLERGHTTRRFLADVRWDDLRQGLTAGEQLAASLRRMEKTYDDENLREYELTKHISLRLAFPFAFLQLRATGSCEIEIPEWMFDQDFPGQYMRRIRNVSLTIPCVAGPYTGVHCRMTLIDSVTRIDPRLNPPPHACCCPPHGCACPGEPAPSGYALCPDDPRAARLYGEREAIATSGGQNDSGLFELSFNDPRYLPFEYMGAVSRWRIELPPETNYFDPDTLSDFIIHLNYTAREGGEALRRAALTEAHRKLPGDGWAFFDVRHDFPDAWEMLRRPHHEEHGRDLRLRLGRRFFPYLPNDPRIRITRLAVCFETCEDDDCGCPEFEGCPCPDHRHPASHKVWLRRPRRGDQDGEVICYADTGHPHLFAGFIDIDTIAFQRGHEWLELDLHLPTEIGEVRQAYLFCRYEVVDPCCCEPAPAVRPVAVRAPAPVTVNPRGNPVTAPPANSATPSSSLA